MRDTGDIEQMVEDTAQRLLPEVADSHRCVYVDSSGARCASQGGAFVHAFVGNAAVGPTEFREVNGLLCDAHWDRVAIPPREWWKSVETGKLVAFAERET